MSKQLGKFIEELINEREKDLAQKGHVKGVRKLSKRFLAKEVLNVSPTWLNAVINGEGEPNDDTLIKLANFFEIDEKQIFLVAERIHPDDLEIFKVKYLSDLRKEFRKKTLD